MNTDPTPAGPALTQAPTIVAAPVATTPTGETPLQIHHDLCIMMLNLSNNTHITGHSVVEQELSIDRDIAGLGHFCPEAAIHYKNAIDSYTE